jgi:hypothetical protein
MAVLGRILQILGWLWLAAGIFGPNLALVNIGVPLGLILVFVARIIRSQAARQEMPELGREQEPAEPDNLPRPVIIDSERQREERPAPQGSVFEPEPSEIPQPDPSAEEERPRKRNQLLEQIVSAGREAADEVMSPAEGEEVEQADPPDLKKPMSSAEMIARAHQRWDSKSR